MATRILILNGPNLNMLGQRQPEVYGRDTLADIERFCAEHAAGLGIEVDFRQSNHEGELVTWIQQARNSHSGIVINPGAYSHTSVALLDALLAANLPVIEVHLSNVHRRESFRHHSYVSRAAVGVICGLGPRGYLMALDGMMPLINTDN
ncbi:MAG: type II 3-dehydroquinate dehydratase [Acetobacterales bacterium]